MKLKHVRTIVEDMGLPTENAEGSIGTMVDRMIAEALQDNGIISEINLSLDDADWDAMRRQSNPVATSQTRKAR